MPLSREDSGGDPIDMRARPASIRERSGARDRPLARSPHAMSSPRSLLASIASALLIGHAGAGEGATDRPPNVVLILVDDMGWTDLGCAGSDLYRTPNIDRLAAQGMRFT